MQTAAATNLEFSPKDFVHLHLHTDYSLLQSTIQLKPLARKLNELGMRACAITDYANMFGAVSFYNQMRAAGIHPVIGYEALVATAGRADRGAPLAAGEKPYYRLVLLAEDLEGYHNLVRLASKAYTEGFYHKPRIDLELLDRYSQGLIALAAGRDGAIGHYLEHQYPDRARRAAARYRDIFGAENFFIEIQDHGLEREQRLTRRFCELAAEFGLGLVATNDAHYLTADDAKAQEILMCIGEGKTIGDGTRTVFESRQYYLRSAAEMWALFGRELPESLENTLRIAERCRVELPLGENLQLPDFPIPADSRCTDTDEYFEEVVAEGFRRREATVWQPQREQGLLKYPPEEYRRRLETETSIIKKMKFPGYFLIVWEFMKYSLEHGIPIGPGRGSAAGSLVAYCLEITDVDPLQYDLLFERFLNPERVSMPDIDIDFCVRRRAEVIGHVTDLYGRDSVCQIVTFGTMASKAAIKDVGRALNMPYGEVEKIAKLIPPPVRGRNVGIEQAIKQVPELKRAIDTDPQVREVIDLARRLEGCARHTSVHAAGVVISPRPLEELVPVAVSAKSELTSQYSMNDLEKVGMLKMDFLALTTLTIISDCLSSIKQKTGRSIDWSRIPLDDPATMRLFGEGRTEAIFQFESSGMQEICRRLKPKELEDLAALNALYRPGPLDGGMVDDFIARHRGEKRVRYIVPQMKKILENTYGILVYQEQIMQLAQKLAGYSLGEADMMRRAMGKKKRREMAVHEKKFIDGAVSGGIDREKAAEIFNLMAQFADYGFNRSHSVAYAYLAYQTAYLKAHFPAYFYASVLSNESQDTAKIYKYSSELRSAGLRLLPPDINESGLGFTPLDDAVRFGLSAIKGIGTASVEAIIRARQERGRFTSLFDFTAHVEQGALNRRGLESLITSGAFDSLKPEEMSVNLWRARLFAGVPAAVSHAQRVWNDRLRGQTGLFAGVEGNETGSAGAGTESSQNAGADGHLLPEAAEWTQKELTVYEKKAVGFYLSAHPLDEYARVLRELKIRQIADFVAIEPGEVITIAGIVSALQVRHSRKGNRFCIFRLEDQTRGVKCLAWSETYGRFSECLKDDEVLILEGRVESNEGQEITLIVEEAKKLADAVPMRAQSVLITLPGAFGREGPDEKFCERLLEILSRRTGKCRVLFQISLDERVRLKFESSPLRISGDQRLENDLAELGCRVNWQV